MRSTEALKDLLPDYVNGTLSPQLMRDIEMHLAICPECKAEAAILSGLLDLEIPPPDDEFFAVFPSRISQAINSEEKNRLQASFVVGSPLSWAIAAMAIFFTLFSIISPKKSSVPVEEAMFPAGSATVDYTGLREEDFPILSGDVPDPETLFPGHGSSILQGGELANLSGAEMLKLETILWSEQRGG